MNEEPQLSAIEATTHTAKTLVDGSLRVTITIEPYNLQKFVSLGLALPGVPIAIARLATLSPAHDPGGSNTPIAGQGKAPQIAPAGLYGDHAEKLWKSGFFFRQEVLEAVGSDEEFLEWIRAQKCCIDNKNHSGDVVAAHIRLVSEGSGTGIKPPYTAVPMCDRHHQLQHQEGYGAVFQGGKDEASATMRVYRRMWAWEALKREFGVDSWKQVDPARLRDWAESHGVDGDLPECYQRISSQA